MKYSACAPYDVRNEKWEFARLQYGIIHIILSLERIILMEKSSDKLVDFSAAFAVEILNPVKSVRNNYLQSNGSKDQ